MYYVFVVWEVYVLMELAVNFWNEDLHWFSGKGTFIDGSVYMRFNRGVGFRVASFVIMWFCIFLWIPNISSCSCIRGF